MSPRLGVRLLAVLLSSTAVLLAPVAAHAERVVTEDTVADALAITFSDGEGDGASEETTMSPAPEETTVDITRTVVQHRTSRLRVTVHYRDLQLVRDPFHLTAIRIVTPQGAFWVNVEKLQRGKATATLERGPREIDCRGLRWSLDEDTDMVTASLPTACLGTPRWVQVGVGAVRIAPDSMTPESEQMRMFGDDAHRDGRISAKSIAKGPKVFAG